MYYSKYLADNLESYVDEETGLTYNPDGSITDVMGATHYPTDDLFDCYDTFDSLLSDEALAEKF